MSHPYLVKVNEHLKQMTNKRLTLSGFHCMDFTIQVTHRKYLGITYNKALLFLGKKEKILALARLVISEIGVEGWKQMSASTAHHLR